MASNSVHTYPEPDNEKLRELILYLIHNSEADPKFGSTKLNKLLFFCDFLAYRSLGQSITGHEYQKLDFGPAPRAFLPIFSQMVEANECRIREEDAHGYKKKRPIALREPRAEVFSGEEIDLIRDVISELWNSNGSEVSELSHRFLGWELAESKETIPYETILASPSQVLDEEQGEWARKAIEGYLADNKAPASIRARP